MKKIFMLFLLMSISFLAFASPEKIIIFRHGEKPEGGMGEINCQGLNRSLALPQVLTKKFGKPDYLFAPDPTEMIHDNAGSFNYVRPLATIEPTAIALGMPVYTKYGQSDFKEMAEELLASEYHHATIFVAWEHKRAMQIAQTVVEKLGYNSDMIPHWSGSDYDSLYVLTIDWSKNPATISFQHDTEDLNNQSDVCAFYPITN